MQQNLLTSFDRDHDVGSSFMEPIGGYVPGNADVSLHAAEVDTNAASTAATAQEQVAMLDANSSESFDRNLSALTSVLELPHVKNIEAEQWLGLIAERFRNNYVYPTESAEPSISDLLKVRRDVAGLSWSFIYYEKNTHVHMVVFEPPVLRRKGQPRTRTPLPDFYDVDEWEFIEAVAKKMEASRFTDRTEPILTPSEMRELRYLASRRFHS